MLQQWVQDGRRGSAGYSSGLVNICSQSANITQRQSRTRNTQAPLHLINIIAPIHTYTLLIIAVMPPMSPIHTVQQRRGCIYFSEAGFALVPNLFTCGARGT